MLALEWHRLAAADLRTGALYFYVRSSWAQICGTVVCLVHYKGKQSSRQANERMIQLVSLGQYLHNGSGVTSLHLFHAQNSTISASPSSSMLRVRAWLCSSFDPTSNQSPITRSVPVRSSKGVCVKDCWKRACVKQDRNRMSVPSLRANYIWVGPNAFVYFATSCHIDDILCCNHQPRVSRPATTTRAHIHPTQVPAFLIPL